MDKELFLKDGVDIKDKHYLSSESSMISKTVVTFKNPDTGEVIWKGHNKVIFPGAEFLALSLFDLNDDHITPSYNTELNLDHTIYSVPRDKNKVYLFCVGTDGCGRENSQVYDVDYRRWIMPKNLVPFRYQALSKDLSPSLRNIYFGKQSSSPKSTDDWYHPDFYAYYFKKFDSEPVFKREWSDGTAVDNTVYTTVTNSEIRAYVTMQMSITKDDCRDYFIQTTGINDARINTMSLCSAWKYEVVDGTKTYDYYQDIRPVTKLNFPNEPLIDLNKGIDITYELYF